MALFLSTAGGSVFTAPYKVEKNPEEKMQNLFKLCEALYQSLFSKSLAISPHIVLKNNSTAGAIENISSEKYRIFKLDWNSFLTKELIKAALNELGLKQSQKDLKEFIVPPNVFRENIYYLVIASKEKVKDNNNEQVTPFYVFPFHDKEIYNESNLPSKKEQPLIISKDAYMKLDNLYNSDLEISDFKKLYSYKEDSEFYSIITSLGALIKDTLPSLEKNYAEMYAIILYGFLEQYISRLHSPVKEFVYYENCSMLKVYVSQVEIDKNSGQTVYNFRGFGFWHNGNYVFYDYEVKNFRALSDYIFYHIAYTGEGDEKVREKLSSLDPNEIKKGILYVPSDLSPADRLMVGKLSDSGITDYVKRGVVLDDPAVGENKIVLEPIKKSLD